MDKDEQIRKRLKEMAAEVGPDITLLARVKSVDEAAFTCVLNDDDDIDFIDVRLRPILDGNKSLTLIPKVNTWALAIKLEGGIDWMLIAAGEFDKWLLSCDNVIFNQGANGGMVNWPDAKAQLDKTNAVVQALVNALTGWVVVPSDGGAALKTTVTADLAGLELGDFNGLEDTKVKH